MPAEPKPELPESEKSNPVQVKSVQVKPVQVTKVEQVSKVEQVEPVRIEVNLARSRKVRAERVKAPRAVPKMLSVKPRGPAPVAVPSVRLPVSFPAVIAPPVTPVVAPASELVLSQRAPVLVADAGRGEPAPVPEDAELASALHPSSAPSGAVTGSTTGLAAVGGLMVLGLVSTRLTTRGRKRRSAPGAAR